MFLEVETNVKKKVNQPFSALYQCPCRKELVFEKEDGRIDEEEQIVSIQFLQTKKNP